MDGSEFRTGTCWSLQGRPLRWVAPEVQGAFHWVMAIQVFTLRYQALPSLLSPLMMRNLVARGREAGFGPRDVKNAVRKGLEQNFLLSRGPAFIPSPVGEAIIAYDHSLQVDLPD